MGTWLKYVAGAGLLLLGLLTYAAWAPDIPHDELAAQYGGPPSTFVTLPSGARAHVRVQGNALGPALVLLHGSNSSLHTWEPWVTRLKRDFRIVTMDLPGHGLTGATPQDDYTYDGMAAFVKEAMGTLDISPFFLGGNSMGGGVALRYAGLYPEDVSGLILVDAAGVPVPPHMEGTRRLPLAFRLAGTWWAAWALEVITPRSLAREGLEVSFTDTSLVTDAMVDRYWHLARHPGNRRATAKRFAWYAGGGNVTDPGKIRAPALILWGRDDGLIPVTTGERLAALLPDARLKIYDGVGHIPMEETPDRSAADAAAFITTLSNMDETGTP